MLFNIIDTILYFLLRETHQLVYRLPFSFTVPYTAGKLWRERMYLTQIKLVLRKQYLKLWNIICIDICVFLYYFLTIKRG